MIENRELSMDDYLAMLRRRLVVILIPTLLAPLAGFAVSYAFAPKFTSQATILVEEQKVPSGYVAPVVTEDLTQRVATLEQKALSAERLRPLVDKLTQQGVLRPGNPDGVMDAIRAGISIQPVQAVVIPPTSQAPKRAGQLPGFNLTFSASNPREAQAILGGLADIIVNENLKDRAAAAQNTTDFLARQVEDAKHNLDDLDAKLANFKRQYIGQLPGDEDNNLKILMGMNSQLDANTQTLNRAQQDKAYAESLLTQQLAAWKESQTSTNPQTLQQQLATLQSQLITLQARYTDDYPDVVKAKRDIAELQKKLNELNAAAANPEPSSGGEKENLSEPAEIRQLRLQIHQYQQTITQATRDQQRLQDQIRLYQGRVALSPAVEEQFKQLTRDYDTAQKGYDTLLAKKKDSEIQTAMEREQQGEQMRLLNPADLPDAPSFPNRLLFAAGGLGAGLALGLGLAFWLELRDTSVRTESDVVAVLDMPVLSQVPWVGVEAAEKNGNGNAKSVSRSRPGDEKKETVEV